MRDGGARKHTNQVAVLEVEAVQLVAGLLCVHDILVNDKGCPLGSGGDALADLSVAGSVRPV